MASKTLTDAECEQRRAQERELVQTAVAQLRSSAGWQAWLTTRRRFHAYSLRNQLLIAHQAPDATRVAGFRAWLALGYCVRKGEKGMRIYAPVPPSKKQLQAWRDAGSPSDQKPRTFFRLTAVFDRAQVDELPPPAESAQLDPPPAAPEISGDQLQPWLAPLEVLADELGCSVTYQPTIASGADGFYRPADRAIVIDATHPANRRVKTLVHELAHAPVHLDRHDDDPRLDYAGEELTAETVAYCACRSSGIPDAGDYSVHYLASYAEQAAELPAEDLAGLIDRLARRVESAVDGSSHDAQPVTTATTAIRRAANGVQSQHPERHRTRSQFKRSPPGLR